MPKNKASAAKDFLSCLCKKVENAAKEDSKVRKIGTQIWSGLNGVQLIVKIVALAVEYVIIGAIVHFHWWPALLIAQIAYWISPDVSKSKTDKEMHKKYGDPHERHIYVNNFKKRMKKIHNLLYNTSTDKITDPKKIKFFEPKEFHEFRYEMAKFYGWYYNWLVQHYKSSKIHRKMEKIIFHNAIQTRYRYEKKQKKKAKPSDFYTKAIGLKQGLDHWVSPEMLLLGRGELLIDPDTHIEPMSHKQIKERYFTNIVDTEASGIYEWCHKEWTLETKWRSKIAEVLRDGPSLEYLEAHHQSWILRYYRFTEQEIIIQHLKAIMPIPLAIVYLYLVFYFKIYDEIQSWMIGYGIWIIFYTCLQEIGILLIDGSWLLDLLCGFKRMPLENFMETLWIPFGVSVDIRRVKNEQWIYLMVSLFPGLIAGYVANYLLEEKYQLLCSSSISDNGSNICQGSICCKLIGSHKEWITFISGLATSILAAWGLVKLVALLILRGDDRYQEMDDKLEEEEEEAIKLEKEELNEELDDEDDNEEDDYEGDDDEDDDDEDPSDKVTTCCSFFTATAKATGNKQAIKIAKTLNKVQKKGYVQKLENKGYDFMKNINKKKKKKKRVFSFEKKHYSKWKPKDVVQFICYSLEDEKYKQHKEMLLKKMKELEFKGLYLKHMDKTDLFLFGITSYAEAVDISHGIKQYIKKQDHEREHEEHKHSDDDGYSSSSSSVSSSSFSSSSSSGSGHSHHSHHHHHHHHGHHRDHSDDKNSSSNGSHHHHHHHHSKHSSDDKNSEDHEHHHHHHHHHHNGHHHHHHGHHHHHHNGHHHDENRENGKHEENEKKIDTKVNEIKYQNGENEQVEENSKNNEEIEIVLMPNEKQQN